MAAIDRLVHHATILEFTGESIRAAIKGSVKRAYTIIGCTADSGTTNIRQHR
jgi:hypothetical protein